MSRRGNVLLFLHPAALPSARASRIFRSLHQRRLQSARIGHAGYDFYAYIRARHLHFLKRRLARAELTVEVRNRRPRLYGGSRIQRRDRESLIESRGSETRRRGGGTNARVTAARRETNTRNGFFKLQKCERGAKNFRVFSMRNSTLRGIYIYI